MNVKATIFEFTSYRFEPDKKRILFKYKTEFANREPLFFTETIILPKVPNIDLVPSGLLAKLLESLHLMLGISYYKLYCATNVRLGYNLSKKEADFWNTVYKNGLGEFFYRNKLNPKICPKFPYSNNKKTVFYSLKKNEECLLGVGGGKDSIVAAELLKQNGFKTTAINIQTHKESELVNKIIEVINIKNFRVKRFLDSQIFQKHQYSGHIPISAIYAFLGILSAVLYKYSYFIVANEYSSNFGNLKYKGIAINHQWSKSFEFEKLFQDYINSFITPDIIYFSLLRNFYEIRIAKIFSKYKKYFPYFSSCNRNFSINKKNDALWCNKCPKCVFVFTLLSAYLSKKDLLNIFKKNLYQDKSLLPLFKDILGFGKMKPFDCVGTFNEAQSALYLASKRHKNDFIVKELLPKIKLYKKVFKTNNKSNVPEQFKFLGMEKVLILGYGKEGKISKRYIKKYYPTLKIGIADEKDSKSYLENQNNFDIAIKTPGIKKELVKIPYTTATNIFFSKIKDKNLIIGVTGSKGKSTTSSLIFTILKEAKKDVELLGNIGKPMLEYLLRPVLKKTVFVLELSSYQLDDIKFSPDIAVITNLFEEHMDYHGNTKNYYKAKKNIINFQNKNNYFVYNPKNLGSRNWLRDYKGIPISFSNNILIKENEIPLIGEHNKDNIKAAIIVAKLLGIEQKIIKRGIKKFKALPHRLELVGEFRGIKFYDDAISTTPESTVMAIKALKNIDTIFLGGQNRGYNFSNLEKTIKKYKIKNIVLFPDSGSKILKSKKGFNILETKKMEEAVKFAYKNTKKESACLLSCASPSYSLWKNFEEKGQEFQKFVKKLSR